MKKKNPFHRLKELSELINFTELIARERERCGCYGNREGAFKRLKVSLWKTSTVKACISLISVISWTLQVI